METYEEGELKKKELDWKMWVIIKKYNAEAFRVPTDKIKMVAELRDLFSSFDILDIYVDKVDDARSAIILNSSHRWNRGSMITKDYFVIK